MPHDIQFPGMCEICKPYYAPYDCPAGVFISPGIGPVCGPCRRTIGRGATVLKKTKGIAAYPIPDGERNDIYPPRFLQRPEGQQ